MAQLTKQLRDYAKGIAATGKKLFSYDAVKSSGRRTSPSATIRHEDFELLSQDRKRLISTTRNLARNMPLIAWALNKHLDATTRFSFHCQCESEELNERIEQIVALWSRKESCDVSKRHPLSRIIRLWEANRILDGDSLLVKVEGGKLQLVEGNRIGKPDSGSVPEEYGKRLSQHGLVLDDYNAVTHYCICNRVDQALVFNAIRSADDCIFDGYFTRPDATRGVSPLAAAINTCVDIAESTEAALMKAKLHAFLGVAIYSDAVENAGAVGFNEQLVGEEEDTDSTVQKYEFQFKPGAKLELEKGDKVDMMESSTPSIPFQEFLKENQRNALSVIGIPYTFWNTSDPNYAGRKLDLVEYSQFIKEPQEANRSVLMNVTEWVLPMLILKDEQARALLKSQGMTIEDVKYDWRAAGRSWIDEQAEVQSTVQRISAGLSSRQRELKKRGESWRDVMEELKGEQALISEYQIPIITGQPGQSVQQHNTEPQMPIMNENMGDDNGKE